jgi:hypothetical protein
MCGNYDNLTQVNSTKIKTVIEKFLDSGIIHDMPRDIEYLDYRYLSSSTTGDERITQDLARLITLIENNNRDCRRYIGSSRINNSCHWADNVPYICDDWSLRHTLLQNLFVNNIHTILWWSGKVPDNLLKYCEVVIDKEPEKINDNIYIFREPSINTSLLLIFNPEVKASDKIISDKDLDKLLYKFLLNKEDDYVEGFSYKTIITEQKKDNLIELINSTSLLSTFQAIRDAKYKTNKLLNDYRASLRNEDMLINDLELNMKFTNKADEFLKTLDKMSDTVSYDVERDIIKLKINSTMFNYDDHVVKTMFDKNTIERYCYYGLERGRHEWLYDLFKKCFLTCEYEFLTETNIVIKLSDRSAHRAPNYYDIVSCYSTRHAINKLTTEDGKTLIPNPHIARFDCWGQNGPVITQLLKDCKWEELLYCLRATVSNLNFNDSTVLETFSIWLTTCRDNQILCKDVSTGEILTKQDLINRSAKEHEENKDNE